MEKKSISLYRCPRVLVVEDASIIQSWLKMMLQELNCSVDIVSDVKHALEKDHKNYDLIILDMRLPDGLGTEISEEFRRRESKKTHILMVMFTAYTETKELIDECLSSGIDKVFWEKKISKEILQTLLSTI